MQLASIFDWIETLSAVRLIVIIPGLYPAISALHILGIGLLVGSIVTVDLRLLNVLGHAFDDALRSLVRIALAGFFVAFTTGLLMLSVRIQQYTSNPAFLAKMLLLLCAGTNAIALRFATGSPDIRRILNTRPARIAGGLSIGIWVSTVFSGRWIAFL
ncbi:DUF6644 family protein [Rhizobium lentis]|uniref:DUF6644 family protein n=1 Tax=Rhizobium lentis TaxID=1138194 RepID=UPI00287F96A6|nr:DUF6644 family protein [Rhizobium lentis]